MAGMDFTTLSGVLASMFEDRVVNQLNRAVVLPQLLPVSAGQGKNIQWVVRTGTGAGAVYSEGADISSFNSDTKSAAVLQYGQYMDSFSLTGFSYAAAAAQGNPLELANLFMEELNESVTRMAQAIGTDIYTGVSTSPQGITGLVGASGGLMSTGTYAGIVRGSVAQWQGNVLTNTPSGTLRPLSMELMRDARRQVYTASGMKPDLVVCSPVQHEKYGMLLGNERRYIQEVTLRGGATKLDGGYQVLEFDGIPVVEDINCPDSKMLFLNTQFVHLKQLPLGPDQINRAIASMAIKGTSEEQYGDGRLPLMTRVQPLAITGDAFKFALLSYLQLQVKRPNSCAVLADLAS